MKQTIKKILVILGISLIWIVVGYITPQKYAISVMGLTGWWSCLVWLWIFPHKN